MDAFELHNARKCRLGPGVAPQPYPCTPFGQKRCLRYLGWVSLNYTMPENIVWVPGWHPNHPYLCAPWTGNCFFWIPRTALFELHNARKHRVRSGLTPQPPIPLHTMGEKRCFWIPSTGVFELHNPRKCRVGSGVAPQPAIPLHTMSQKKCFWMTRMGVFDLHNARKHRVGYY